MGSMPGGENETVDRMSSNGLTSGGCGRGSC